MQAYRSGTSRLSSMKREQFPAQSVIRNKWPDFPMAHTLPVGRTGVQAGESQTKDPRGVPPLLLSAPMAGRTGSFS